MTDETDRGSRQPRRSGGGTAAVGASGRTGRFRRRGELAYEHVKGQLLTGCFAPGSALPVEQIAADLEVSRQPVMEAMKRLAAERFVAIIPQVGCQVMRVSADDVADHFRLFAAAEGLLAEFAATRWQDNELDALDGASLAIRSVLDDEADAGIRIQHYRDLNRDLHDQIYRMSRAAAIADIAQRLADLADFYIATMTPALLQPSRAEIAQDEHEQIVDMIRHRQAERAGQAMSAHIQHFGHHILDELAKQP